MSIKMKLLADGDYHNWNEINKSPKRINKRKMSLYGHFSVLVTVTTTKKENQTGLERTFNVFSKLFSFVLKSAA